MSQKQLIVIGGPNGAGKTTLALEFLANHDIDFLSADAIAYRMNPSDPTASRMPASVEFIQSFKASLEENRSVAIESTLSGRSLLRKIKIARQRGFALTMFFVFLESEDASVKRVQERVRKGGHDVPEEDIRRRFSRSISNFWNLYSVLADNWILVYNSGDRPIDVAIGSGTNFMIRDKDRFDLFQSILKGSHV